MIEHPQDLATHPMAVIRLRGSQAEMGAQHGQMLRELGGWEEASTYYPRMASRLLTLRFPERVRRTLTPVFHALLTRGANRLNRKRRELFPEYYARTLAMLEAGGLPDEVAQWFGVMDVFQNAVSMVSRYDILKASGIEISGIPACSSLAVWGASSDDGTMRHARNFDFPGVGVWDEAPAVVFCDPDEGLRYGFVTTRGADTPGVTAFNEAGLTVTVHTRFHRDVAFDKACVVDIGHEIIRRSRTIDEAIAIAQSIDSASTWGFLVSSADEKDAVLIEMTADATAVERAGDREHLECTNRYRTSDLWNGELTTSPAFRVDSHAREQRLRDAVEETADGLSRSDLELLLGDLRDAGSVDGKGSADRLAGNCIMSPITVQSIVSEPDAHSIRVSVGRAPTGFGPYISVPWDWDSEPGGETIAHPTAHRRAQSGDGTPLTEREHAAVRSYVASCRQHMEGQPNDDVRQEMEAAVASAPAEPHFRFLAGMLAVIDGDFEGASENFDQGLIYEFGDYRRAILLLWASRVRHAAGDSTRATEARVELSQLAGDDIEHLQAAATTEARRPKRAGALRSMVPDLFLVDA